MDKRFYIKKGSFCFIIPFFTENSDVCNEYFEKLSREIDKLKGKSEIDKKKGQKDATRCLKGELVAILNKGGFCNAKSNFQPDICQYKDYKGRFLCNCVSSAVKFHDDVSQSNNAVQFFLDSYEVKYRHNNFICQFDMNILLYIVHEKSEKAAYIVIDIDLEKTFVNIKSPIGIDPNVIIFIKHLFYKEKMIVKMHSKLEEKWQEMNLQEWIRIYVRDLCGVLNLDPERDVPKFAKSELFRYTFIELKKIYGDQGEILQLDFDNIKDDFLASYSKISYGLLLSDEGWEKTPIEIVRNRLNDYWTTRRFYCAFFLQHNALLYNIKESNIGNEYTNLGIKWFSRYMDNKYSDYVKHFPCITGIDTLALFPFFKAIYKEIIIERYLESYKNENDKKEKKRIKTFIKMSELKSRLPGASKRIDDVKKELDKLEEILSTPALNLGEMANLEQCIYKQFGLMGKMESMRLVHNHLSDKLHFEYEKENNTIIRNLTFVTVILGLISLLLMVIQMSVNSGLSNSFILNY